jgi:hypothetical protein
MKTNNEPITILSDDDDADDGDEDEKRMVFNQHTTKCGSLFCQIFAEE